MEHLRDWMLGPRIATVRQYPPRPLRLPKSYLEAVCLAEPPVISVVTPSFNQGRFLERTIQSVLCQNYPRLEYIVQDGGSTDSSLAILERYAGRLLCDTLDDRGQGHAINLAMEHATGEILAYLNSDDLYLPGALAYVAKYLQDHGEVDAVYGHRIVINAEDREIGRWVMPAHDDRILPWADYVPQETLFWRRSLWEAIGEHIAEDLHAALDWDLLLRMRSTGARIVRLPRFLGAFRVHRAQKTSALGESDLRERTVLQRRELGFEPSQKEIRRAVRRFLLKNLILQRAHQTGVLKC